MPGKKKQVEELEGDNTSTELDVESVDITDADFKADKTGATQVGNIDLSDDDEIDEEDEDEAEAPVSIVDKIKALFNKKKNKKSTAAPSKKGEKKSIISKPIAGIILIGVVAFLFGDQLFPPESDVPAVNPEEEKILEAKKKRAADKKAAKEAAAPAAKETDATVTDPEVTPIELDTDPTIPGEAPTTDTTTENPPIDTTTTTPDFTPTEPSEEPTSTHEPVMDPVDTASVDVIDPDTMTQNNDENMTDKILEDLEKQVKEATPRQAVTTYVNPPDYEYRGRGLVYNCVGKHWACVDGPSYRVCEDNSSSTKFLKKRNECYPFNVYQTQNGCEKTQNRMVSSGAKTKFCNE